MMDNQDRILSIVRQKGPLLPSQINKELGVNVLFASAMLGELCDKHLLRLTKLKVGGSPLYYVPGQEAKLTAFADKLGEKDRRAYNLLKQDGVLLDSEMEALFRIALRSIRDFAVPLDVNAAGERHLFWKWYLLPNQDAERKIMEKLGVVKEEKKMANEPTKEEGLKPAESPVQKEQAITVDVTGTTRIETEHDEDESPPPLMKNIPQRLPTGRKPKREPTREATEPKTHHREDKKKEETKKQGIAEDTEPELLRDAFYQRVLTYFEKNNIKVESTTIVRMGVDIEFLVHLPTSVGLIPYFCKAKNKKRCDDDDMAKAYLAGQKRRLPILFLYAGELTKKVKEAAASEYRTVILREV